MTAEERQAVLDEEHLRLLALFHYISGGLTLAFSLFFGLWALIVGAMFTFFPPAADGAATPHPHTPPAALFSVFGLLFVVGLAYAVLEIVSGRLIGKRRRRVFTIVVALPRLLFIPYGVILSIFTLVVLERPTVKRLYDADRAIASGSLD